jgi:hypothetical protein
MNFSSDLFRTLPLLLVHRVHPDASKSSAGILPACLYPLLVRLRYE